MKLMRAYQEHCHRQVVSTFRSPLFVFREGQITFEPKIMVEQVETLGRPFRIVGQQDAMIAAGLLKPEMRLQGRKRTFTTDAWKLEDSGGGTVTMYVY